MTDTSDARIAAASVTLTNTETGVSQTTAANPAGLYRFDAVETRLYNLKVTHPGFKAFTGVGFRVEVNRTTTIRGYWHGHGGRANALVFGVRQ